MRVPHGVAAGEWWRRFNGSRALVWVCITGLALMFGWVYSVAFVAACSLYANIASDVASWRADVNPQLDRIEDRLTQIEETLSRVT